MNKFALRIAPAVLALFAFSACSNDNEPGTAVDTSSPEEAVLSTVEMMQNNNIDGLLRASLPPAEYQELRSRWGETAEEPITDEDRAKFAQMMQQLTAPGAEEALFAQLKPMLDQYETKYKAQLPMYIGMGQTMAATAINNSEDLTPDQKTQAMSVMAALAGWLQTTDWSDQAKAKQAIAIVTDTARTLNLETLDQVRALTYEQAMPKISTGVAGLKQVLAVYGFDLNAALDSVTAKTVSKDAGTATVEYSYTLLGQPISGSTKLVERDGNWYNADTLAQFDEAMAKAASAEAPAAEATVGAE